MAQRPIWEGHLRLSLVACPVSLFTATSSASDINFHLINPKTGNRIRTQAVDPETGEVDRKTLVRGFEIEKDRYLLLTNDEIKSVRLESTETIDIERFVDSSEIDRIWWNDPYYLAPDGKAGIDAYIVIRDAMRESAEAVLADVLAAVADESGGIALTGRIELGSAATTLVEASGQAELLVVGRRGHGGFLTLVIGSVAQQVAAHAKCPVVIVEPE